MNDHEAKVASDQHWDCFGEWVRLQDQAPFPLDQLYGPARSQCPVQRIRMPDGSPAWAVLGRDEVDQVLMDPKTFSNAMSQFGPTPLIPIEMDPPEHTGYRRILNRLINGQVAERLAPAVRRYTAALLEPVLAAGGGDMRPITEELTLRALCCLIGVPDDDWTIIRNSQAGRSPGDVANTTADAVSQRFTALAPVIDYAKVLIERRKHEPRVDLVTGLIQARLPDRALSDDEILQMLVLVLLGGHETTRSALLSAMMLLSCNPDAQAALRSKPERIPTAVEECLRIEGPVQGLFRIAAEDVEIAGQTINRGSLVMPFYGAANHDPAAFACPASFDMDRPRTTNYAFGRGTHLCVGAPIARMEMRVFLEELLSITRGFKVSGAFERENVPDLSFRKLELTFL